VLVRLIHIAMLGALFGVPVIPAAAQQAAPETLEIAVVDVQRILRDSAASRNIRPQLEKLKQDFQARFKKQEEVLRAANQDLNRQRAILSPEAYEAQRKAFRARASEAQREVQAARRQFDSALATAMRRVHTTLLGITQKYAQEKGIKLILPRSGVLLMKPSFDITAELLKRLDKQLPSLKVELPPASATAPKGKDGTK